VAIRKSKPKASAADERAQLRAYFAALPPTARKALRQVHQTIKSELPKAVPGVSYGIPVFRVDGKAVVWCAAFKGHLSVYPIGAAIVRANAAALKGRKTSTGTVQFALDAPPSTALVRKLVRARVAQFKTRGK
jgi:uncharacterized protein YdhG (YjbR/CyaY superfamily)